MTNHTAEFTQAMQAMGFSLDKHGVIDDGKIHRAKCPHDKGNKQSGRYYLHTDGLANGAFGCYHDSENALENDWQSTTPTPPMSDSERKAYGEKIARQQAEREAQTKAEQQQAKQASLTLWNQAHEATTANAYIQRKGIRAYGVRELNGALLIPLYDGKPTPESLCNVQFIQPDGTKRFKTGAQKKGAYFAFGARESKTVVVCEGFATGASIAEAAGHYVVVCFDAGNMRPVAERINASLPNDWTMIIAGDNDAFGTGDNPTNKGKATAEAVAMSLNARVVIPNFTGCDMTTKPTDFNDLHQLAGLEAVRAQIEGAGTLTLERVAEFEQEATTAEIEGNATAHATPENETDEQIIERLSDLSDIDLARCVKTEAERMGISTSDLKRFVTAHKKAKGDPNEKPSAVEIIDPWDYPVDGAEVLNEVMTQLQAHVIADVPTLHLASLWVCFTWFIDVATVAPVALITAPERNCGKSTLLFALSKMSKSALVTANMSTAVLFRLIDLHTPTLFIDEVDTWLKDNEELRGILNAGHSRDGAHVWRCEGDNFEPTKFSVWGAKAISGISAQNISDTLLSRSVVLNMRRKLKGESALNIRHTTPETFTTIKRKLARFAEDNARQFSTMRPLMQGLSNRDQDNYEPLLAIAQIAGGEWVGHLERACRVSIDNQDDNKSVGVELLEACKDIFDRVKSEKIYSSELLDYLIKDEDSVFSTYNRGKPISPRQVSKRLGDYGIKSKDIRRGYEVKKGYEKIQFLEAWKVYLDGEDLPENATKNEFSTDTGILSATTLQTSTHAAYSVADGILEGGKKTLSATLKPAPVKVCSVVADRNPQNDEIIKKEDKSNGLNDFFNEGVANFYEPKTNQNAHENINQNPPDLPQKSEPKNTDFDPENDREKLREQQAKIKGLHIKGSMIEGRDKPAQPITANDVNEFAGLFIGGVQ